MNRLLKLTVKVLGLVLMVSAMATVASAKGCGPSAAPEIDPASAGSAVALLSGLYFMVRDRFRQ